MTVAGLSYPIAFEHNGLIYLIGYRSGAQYIRRSADGGQSWLPFGDGATEKLAAASSDPDRVALVKMDTQGCRLMVAVPNYPNIDIYISADDGESWELEASL